MDEHRIALLAILGLAIVILVYQAQTTTEDQPIPLVQGEAQMMGLGVGATLRYNAGTPLDMTAETHFWHPMFDPDPSHTEVVLSRHRYPIVPGGNISTVMHKGWGSFCKDSPIGNDWRVAPPEVAVL